MEWYPGYLLDRIIGSRRQMKTQNEAEMHPTSSEPVTRQGFLTLWSNNTDWGRGVYQDDLPTPMTRLELSGWGLLKE